MEAAVREPDVGGRRLPIVAFSDLEKPLRCFDQGGFGDIHRSQVWGSDVALKLVRGTRQTEKELIKEARLMEQAQFTYVLPLRAFYSNPEGDCVKYGLVTEYMPNGSLSTLFSKVSPVPWALRFRIIHQVALGMRYLHDLKPPLLHLDLKRSNVLLDENLKVQLADFGLSKLKSSTEPSSAGNIAGTLAYMPPEALGVKIKKKESFDIYSFGVLTWTVLAAKEPYEGADPSQILLCVPKGQRPDLEPLESQSNVKMLHESIALMEKCWQQDAAERPPFQVCIGKTEVMFHAYAEEVVDAVRWVQDTLKKKQTEGNQKAATQSTSTGETDSTYPYTDSFHPSMFKTKPVVTPPPSREPSAAAPSQQRTTGTGHLSPATPKAWSKTGSMAECLKKNFSRLTDEIPSVQPMLNQLKEEKIFNREEVETISSNTTLTGQIRTMLMFIQKKGEHSSKRFCHLLNEAYPDVLSSIDDS